MTAVLVILGAMVGAPARYLVDRAVQSRHGSVIPWGTITVNIVGSAILGLLAVGLSRHGISKEVMALIGTGFCGTLTTYSTFSYETVRLLGDGHHGPAAANVGISLVAGLSAAGVGALTATLLWH